MSHAVTMRTTTTTTGISAITLNTEYLKTLPGILKSIQVALGIVCVGIMGQDDGYFLYRGPWIFFYLMSTTFMIASFVLLLSCLVSLSTSSIISKTIYEVIYHLIGFGLLLAASLTLLVKVNNSEWLLNYNALLAAAYIGLVNTALYLISAVLALRSYRGI